MKSCNDKYIATFQVIIISIFVAFIFLPNNSFAKMNAPKALKRAHKNNEIKTSTAAIVFSWAIDMFQSKMTRIDGARCGFYPTCSQFGKEAIRDYGAFKGIAMTGDRLIRCNQHKKPGYDYQKLKNGRLSDPVDNNK